MTVYLSRKGYDRQFKMSAVKLVLEDAMSVSEVAKELSIITIACIVG